MRWSGRDAHGSFFPGLANISAQKGGGGVPSLPVGLENILLLGLIKIIHGEVATLPGTQPAL